MRNQSIFHSEEEVSRNYSVNANVVLNCIKNGRPFCAEYQDEDGVHFYKDCVVEQRSYRPSERAFVVNCTEGRVRILASMITYISSGVIAFGLMEG